MKESDEKICYCQDCLGINIQYAVGNVCYCADCGSAYISETSFTEWENIFKEKYKVEYLTLKKKQNGRNESLRRWKEAR